jgi:hypothetical protein
MDARCSTAASVRTPHVSTACMCRLVELDARGICSTYGVTVGPTLSACDQDSSPRRDCTAHCGRSTTCGGRTEGDTIQPVMTALHEHYVWQVNEAVAEDRMNLVQQLNEEYIEEALRLILATA